MIQTPQQNDSLSPFLDIVPSSDGKGIIVSARGIGAAETNLYANVSIGPGGKKNSYTMPYAEDVEAYATFVSGFEPVNDIAGTVSLSTTQGASSQTVWFDRLHIDAEADSAFVSSDGLLRMIWLSADALPDNTYLAISPGLAPPGPIPAGHQVIGSTYTVRASGSLVTTDAPLLLELAYDPSLLSGIDPHTLDVFTWDANPDNPRWVALNAQLDDQDNLLSVSTSRLATYALLATPSWRDEFLTTSSLDVITNVVTLASSLTLSDTTHTGTAVSQLITLSEGDGAWDTITFTAVADPPDTTVTVDILDAAGNVLLADVGSGDSLQSIDPARHDAIKLRATLASTVEDESPTLERWQVSQTIASESLVYLPLIVR
ncbi:MAG: hypothetical protein HC884_04770 [Chloroflexaceae bacterium]|nr:hypothetical protein [Chloroflexaceae bacterium]